MDATQDTPVAGLADLLVQNLARVHLLFVSYRFAWKSECSEHRCSAIFGLPAERVLRIAPELQKIV